MTASDDEFHGLVRQARLQFRVRFPRPAAADGPAVHAWLRGLGLRPDVERAVGEDIAGRILRLALPPADGPGAGRPDAWLDEFALYQKLGEGGMGVVYLAYDTRLTRWVAVKRAKPGRELELGGRFQAEVRLTAEHPHPGIPAVHALRTDAKGHPYMVMEFMAGVTLRQLFSDRGFGPEHRHLYLDVFVKACQTLGDRHGRGVVHGDVSPGNVMVAGAQFETVRVFDWGLGRTAGGAVAGNAAPRADGAAPAGGTPHYMAPEQFAGPADARTDVFLLGGVLCELLTGRPPYVGPTPEAVRDKARRADLADALVRLGESDQPALAALAGRCLAPDPADRPSDAGVVAREVTAVRAAAEDARRRAEGRARDLRVELDRAEVVRKHHLEMGEEKARRRRLAHRASVGVTLALGVACALGLFLHYSTRAAAASHRAREHNRAAALRLAALTKLGSNQPDRLDRADAWLAEAIDVLYRLTAEEPDDPAHAYDLAQCYMISSNATFLRRPEDPAARAEAVHLLERAEALFDGLNRRATGPEPVPRPDLNGLSPEDLSYRVGRDQCRYVRALLLLMNGDFSESFEVLDDLTEAWPAARRSRRAAGLDLLARLVARARENPFPPAYSPSAEAIADYREVMQLAAEMEQAALPWSRGGTADHDKAMRLAARLADSPGVSPAAVYNAACTFSIAAAAADLSAEARQVRTDGAMRYLARLRSAKYFLAPTPYHEFHTDPDLNALRSTAAFGELCRQIEQDHAWAGFVGSPGALVRP